MTSLIADGKKYTATGSYTYEGDLKASNISRASLSLPTERIGSKTNAVNAVIDNIVLTSKVVKEDLTEGAIDSKDFTVTADNENSDGKIQMHLIIIFLQSGIHSGRQTRNHFRL